MPKDFLCNVHDIGSMCLIQGKDKSLWEIVHVRLTLWVGEHLGIDTISICFKHQLDLSRIDDTTIKLFLGVLLGFSLADGFYLASIASFASEFVTLFDSTTILCYLCLDTVDTAIHVDTINDTLFKGIVDNAVVVEECHGLRNWSRCKTYHLGSCKVVKNFLPVAIDATMALVNNNDIKEILWQSWIFWQFYRCVVVIVIFVCICNVFALQQREKSLYS